MFTPSNPTKATNPINYCLEIEYCQIAHMNLATLDRQIVSKNLAISVCRITSINLAT
jgi:hypothetical protein